MLTRIAYCLIASALLLPAQMFVPRERKIPKARAAEAQAAAAAMFTAARSAMGTAPSGLRPEYVSYLAEQEAQSGEAANANRDRAQAFRLAAALPAGGLNTQVKQEIEPGAIEALIQGGDFADAANLAAQADAGRGEILSAMVAYLLARNQASEAWRWWGEMKPKAGDFPFGAARRLLGAAGGTAEAKAAMRAAGEQQAARVESAPTAEQAMDFLEADAADAGAAGSAAEATRALVARLDALDLAGWEAKAILDRARALVGKVDPHHPLLVTPAQGLRPHATARAATERTPPSDLAPFTAEQALQHEIEFNQTLEPWGREPKEYPERLVTAKMAAEAPSFVARWAWIYYCQDQAQHARPLLVLALNAVDAQVAAPRAAAVTDYDGVPFWVYGLAAQMDFALARRRAEALPPGWFRPLALAHVARMAMAAAANEPKHCTAVVY